MVVTTCFALATAKHKHRAMAVQNSQTLRDRPTGSASCSYSSSVKSAGTSSVGSNVMRIGALSPSATDVCGGKRLLQSKPWNGFQFIEDLPITLKV